MLPARRTDPARDHALEAVLERLAAPVGQGDNPDGWITAARRLPARSGRYAPFNTGLDPRLVEVLRARDHLPADALVAAE